MSDLIMHLLAVTPPNGAGAVLPDVATDDVASIAFSAMDLLNGYAHVFLVAFLVALLTTPIVRRIAIAHGIIDHPDEVRKVHREPIAYLGGLAVFAGLLTAIVVSWFVVPEGASEFDSVPLAVAIGMCAITFTGLADDVWGWDPRLKVAGQLVAAAALALNNVGNHVAEGALKPLVGGPGEVLIPIPGFEIMNADLFYWVGTALIAIFVLGGCNSANLIDGLDGLLSGVVAIVAVGLLAISLLMALDDPVVAGETGSMAGPRLVLCMALLGAVLGFLPHNFNPASIFLGDCGSLLLGYMCAVIILMLGDQGQTHLVFAGLIIFAIPIMDTTLAIIRRKLSGQPLSSADDQHIHHQIKRAVGGVKRAVLALYGIGVLFAGVGVTLAALQLRGGLRVRVIYAIAIVLFGFIGVIAVKAARRQQHQLVMKKSIKPRSQSAAPGASDRPKAPPSDPTKPVEPKPS